MYAAASRPPRYGTGLSTFKKKQIAPKFMNFLVGRFMKFHKISQNVAEFQSQTTCLNQRYDKRPFEPKMDAYLITFGFISTSYEPYLDH